jgi:hypothetical protein
MGGPLCPLCFTALAETTKSLSACGAGKQDGMHRHKECLYRAELDMETLVWTRGKGLGF